MQVISDLEVHSKYARAVSSSMTPPIIAEWAAKKGIDLVGSGDFTHPLWLRELEANLEESGEGIYRLKSRITNNKSLVNFLLTSEVSCMYTHRGKGRRVHMMVYLPDFESVKKFNQQLSSFGANLFSDGRPIMGLSLAQVAEIALEVSEKALVIPAHVWTPWFGFYGSMSGYDSLKEAFGDLEKYIPAVETGLSSDPAMNWRIAELVNKRIVSFGDAHSPQKLGREATVFELPEISYENIWKALFSENQNTQKTRTTGVPEYQNSGKSDLSGSLTIRQSESSEFSGPRILYTIEFYPEEGKYHYTGHRNCKIVYSPNEARKMGMTCPVCGKILTMGVMSRVETLASIDVETESENDSFGVRLIKDKGNKRPAYFMLVPLQEVLSEALGAGVGSQVVTTAYERLVNTFSSEFSVLLKTKLSDISKIAGRKVSEAIKKVRSGDIFIKPGYDGVFGSVKIWREGETDEAKPIDQGALF